MKVDTMQDLFVIALQHMYDLEKKLVAKGLPTMIKAAQSSDLRSALEQHLEETRTHVSRLEQVFGAVGEDPGTKDNDIFDEMSDEVEDMISSTDDNPLRDAALIAAGNQVEHFEMANYGTLVAWSQQLGLSNVVSLLQKTLEEEKAADAKLTALAEQSINPQAGTRAA